MKNALCGVYGNKADEDQLVLHLEVALVRTVKYILGSSSSTSSLLTVPGISRKGQWRSLRGRSQPGSQVSVEPTTTTTQDWAKNLATWLRQTQTQCLMHNVLSIFEAQHPSTHFFLIYSLSKYLLRAHHMQALFRAQKNQQKQVK